MLLIIQNINNKKILMIFLQKNMETVVRDNNKNKLISDLKIYLILNKINTEKEFGLNYLEIIHEQKRRIDAFDAHTFRTDRSL